MLTSTEVITVLLFICTAMQVVLDKAQCMNENVLLTNSDSSPLQYKGQPHLHPVHNSATVGLTGVSGCSKCWPVC